MAKYVMRYDVKHGESGKVWDLPQGAECPPELLKKMQELGHVEIFNDKPPAPAPAASVSKRITQPQPSEPAEEDGDVEPEKEKRR